MQSSNSLDTFLAQMKPGQISTILMDMLPEIITCIKDINGVYIYVNRAFAETLQRDSEEILGKNDAELFGTELARSYMKDDADICESGDPILEKAELVTYRPGIVRWYITSKIPLYNTKQTVIGIAGISRPSLAHQHISVSGPMASVGKAVDYIYENLSEGIGVDQLANICGLSISSLERHFKKHFDCSPGKFISQVKISSACKLLADPSYTIAAVGDKLGYPDPVVFSRAFKREMKVSPSGYRRSLIR
ncbi:AraC family transcriptional regulator [Oceaniferula spumae]|uniref:AraC family transcriptional regulator n=1 Tax=Oceaniferula spumae TaxID=2979115 RepID=A0AAT9FRN7_9BACT